MAIDCNDIHTVAEELKERFESCYKLTAEDMDTVVELIQAVEICVSAGTGFMTKSVYDTDDDGVVNNSELVNGLTVETAVPPNALFTDTITDISGKEDHLGNPSISGQVLSSTTGGVRSWVTTLPGGGDMATGVYDTNLNNIVDNSELVNGLTVETAVPSGAVFTDTIYDDTALTAVVNGKEDSLGNPGTNGYVLTSTIAGVRTWSSAATGITNLSFTAAPTVGTVHSDTGTDATISLADVTNAGLLSPADFVLLQNTTGVNTGDSPTNLSYIATSTDGTVTSSDGTNAILSLADATNAGLLTPAHFVLIGNQSGINTGDQDANEVAFTPAGDIAANDVQAAIEELDAEKVANGRVLTDVPAGASFTDTLYEYGRVTQLNTNYSTANNDSDTLNVYEAINPLTTITLDDTNVSVGFQQQIVNNTSGTITIDLAVGDTVIGGANPFSLPVGYFVYYVKIAANRWAVSIGQTSAATTNLGFQNRTSTQYEITSSSGTNATVTGATTSLAGALTAADKTSLDSVVDPATNTQTGTTYTIVDADKNKTVTLNNAASITVTVPDTLSLPVGAEINLMQLGAGVVTVAAGGTATVNKHANDTLSLDGQYSVATLKQESADTWVLFGRLA